MKLKQNLALQSKGFTLVEMMVAVAILGILAAIAIPSYSDYIEKGELTDAKQAALAARQNFEANRLARPREFQTAVGFNKELNTMTSQISAKSTLLYTFTPTSFGAQNGGAPVGFTFKITPRKQGKKYFLTIDESGNAQRCKVKATSSCERF